jgi:large subunit ribosomal protein L17
MRHGKKFNHLSRKSAHRKSMLANMACSLIEHKRIKTTLAKAKALRIYIEPLITKSKTDTTHSRRVVFSYLKQKEAISELFSDVATKVMSRPGGYTRILKLSNRLGDNAQMAYIELVDYNEDYKTDKPIRKKARRAKKKTGEVVMPLVEDISSDEVKQEDSLVEDVSSEEVKKADSLVEDVSSEEVKKADSSVEDVSSENVKKEDSTVEDVASEDVEKEDNNPETKEKKGE